MNQQPHQPQPSSQSQGSQQTPPRSRKMSKGVIIALITAIGVIVAAIITAIVGPFFNAKILTSATPTPSPSSLSSLTPTPSLSLTATPQPLCPDNLINCNVQPIYSDQSTCIPTFTQSGLQVIFNNVHVGTGVAFELKQPLDGTPFHFVEITGKSTKQFSFLLEYKVKTSKDLKIVSYSDDQLFLASSVLRTVEVPMRD